MQRAKAEANLSLKVASKQRGITAFFGTPAISCSNVNPVSTADFTYGAVSVIFSGGNPGFLVEEKNAREMIKNQNVAKKDKKAEKSDSISAFSKSHCI